LWRSCTAACQWALIASPPFLQVLSVSPSSFLQLRPELDKAADQICRELAIFLSGSLSVFALRRIAKLVRFRVLAMVSTLFELRTSARSSLSRSGVQGRRGVPVICHSPPSRRDRSLIVGRQANAVPRLKRTMRLPFADTDYTGLPSAASAIWHAARGILTMEVGPFHQTLPFVFSLDQTNRCDSGIGSIELSSSEVFR
jgi:hypothetical protein